MSQRQAFILSFLTIVVILGTGVYLEYFRGIMPCPLCTLQRICFGACGLLFLLGIFLYRKPCVTLMINLGALVFSVSGIFLAGRQIWIQSNPAADTSACGVSINYMLSILPWQDVAKKIFSGSTECAQRGWELLGLNIPEWSILFFAVFASSCLYFLIRGYSCKTRS